MRAHNENKDDARERSATPSTARETDVDRVTEYLVRFFNKHPDIKTYTAMCQQARKNAPQPALAIENEEEQKQETLNTSPTAN